MPLRRCKRRRLFICVGLIAVSLVFLIKDTLFVSLFASSFLADEFFFQSNVCPACYGTSLCKQLEGRLWIAPYLTDPRASMKGVRYAEWDRQEGKVKVVTKNLGYAAEIKNFDEALCLRVTGERQCAVHEAVKLFKIKSSEQIPSNLMQSLTVGLNLSDHFHCMSDRLKRKIIGLYDTDRDGSLNVEESQILATTLQVNREPIILQLFPQDEGWPFPQYYGACGRTIIAEYGGRTLESYMKKSWEFRVWLSVQLLQIAFLLTDNSHDWALYLTDIRPANFALSENGQVLVIDAEHVEIVDMQEVDRKQVLSDLELKQEDPECSRNHVRCGIHSSDLMCLGIWSPVG
ncbi:divergent protein kinase domain 2A-like isoform X2 [Corticium candelabrum]|uniref:divergent protein kinase domain 2A-like isoform X2 n=1 Tax=Corticium candelabrum TaxID=121492 RepID=UPI002E255081|nr:divergent protein kinase domain 2A-like isoform X2 [Corticium candelabrum]